jgi:5-methylcytosine-specific restriction protein A
MQSSDDEEFQGFEGQASKLFILHRRREAKLRKRKLEDALRLNQGRLVCEVPNCEFDFAERYGELGIGYAQLHHKEPLSNAPRQGRKITLKELAVACANCHAMIHKGGQCRPLDTLIPQKSL